ncbi:MAG: GHKL domain-containing protein [Robiginitomaculum sp.]|nr:GHKL domain-containing protein [Robiginitomaculum sp.]
MKLSVKLPLLIIFLVLFFTIGYQSIFYIQIQQNIVDSRISEAKSIIQLSSDEFRNSVYFLNYETINLQIENLKRNPLIENVMIMHPDGRIISDGTISNENFDVILNDDFILSSINSDKLNLRLDDDIIHLSTPIKIIDKIGILYIDYSLSDVNQILENTFFVILVFSSILGMVGIVVGISISTSITKPITKIKILSNKIAQGNFETNFDLEKSSTTEINDLQKSLQEMTVNMKKYQSDIIKAERFSAIGELSARIAHDIRNPLSVISNSIFVLERVKNDPEKFKKVVERMNRAEQRITHQIDEVMDFLRNTNLQIEEIHLKNMFDLLLSELPDTDELKINPPKNDVVIFADKTKLNALFSNLIMNAFQAIQKDGTITIMILESNDKIHISVEDSGPGVPEEDIENIFEPLFTTKQEGTGLGLASCKKIIEQHKGTISVKNNPTIFTITLPKNQET